jgi:hypothetical protein
MSQDAVTFNKFDDVTPSDTLDLPQFRANQKLTGAIYVGTAGDVAVVSQSDVVTIFDGVPAGAVLPVAAKRVNSTGTAASDIVALYQV